MVPTPSYSSMIDELAKREECNPSIPITVGIILANAHTQFCHDHILQFLPEYNRTVGKLLNFYMPGYYIDDECKTPVFSLKGDNYNFEQSDFFHSRDILNKLGIPLSESPQLILVEYHNHKLRFHSKKTIIINLERAFYSGQDICTIFEQLVKISRKTAEYSMFRERYLRQKKGASFIHFIKKEMPSLFLSQLVSEISKIFTV